MDIDFEFTDDLQRTYRCLTREGEPWLFFLINGEWMPLKTITESEIKQYREAARVLLLNF